MAPYLTVGILPAKFGFSFNKSLIQNPNPLHHTSKLKFKSNLGFKSSLKCRCIKKEITDKPTEEFSVLSLDIPWERGSIWSTMALYMFNFHIPLGIGGLSIVANVLQQPVLDPQTEVLSLLAIQILELAASLLLLKSTAKPEYEVVSFFKTDELSKKRNWLLASSLGFGFLVLLVFLTSLVADRLIGPKAVNNPIVKEILLSSSTSKVACILVYCLVTPLLEEIVYRGFLLKSLASTMNWQQAVLLSSAVFSAAHFSVIFSPLLALSPSLDMGDFENKVKVRAKELTVFFKKGVKIVGESCKKGWIKVKNMKKR
uniref:CAAX prenyl protease 2/Lysostaphin resistance protein A-like domain-containing protein n=1 Tax=Populus alba TaxID=43335 RepID=A0A4U5NSG8_POPAL|nr:uncharacterized protein D5086_0000241950 [Populus alba]